MRPGVTQRPPSLTVSFAACRWQIRLPADPGDLAVGNRYRRIVDGAIRRPFSAMVAARQSVSSRSQVMYVPVVTCSSMGRFSPCSWAHSIGAFVTCIGMTHDAGAGIVGQHVAQAPVGILRAVAQHDHAGMLREAHADAAAVMQADPGGTGGAC